MNGKNNGTCVVVSAALTAVLLAASAVVVTCDDSIPVVYTADNFESSIGEHHHFVKFYAPWCGHCKRLAPTSEDLASKFNSDSTKNDGVVIAKVDCTTDTSVCADQDVTAYPTLKFFKKGVSNGVKYRGARDLKSLSDFVLANLELVDEESTAKENGEQDGTPSVPNSDKGLQILTDETFKKFTERGEHFVKFYAPWCGHCQKLAPTWDSLAESLQHDPSIHVSKIDCTENRVTCNELEVKSYPTLLWIKDGKKVEKYQGSRTHEDLKTFVTKMKENALEDTESEKDEGEEAEPTGSVVELSAKNFDTVIQKEVVFVKFFAPWCGHCKALAPTWEKLATKFLDNAEIIVAKVDCTVEQDLCRRSKVEGYPTLLIYSKGKFIKEYDGNRALEDLFSFVQTNVPRHDEL